MGVRLARSNKVMWTVKFIVLVGLVTFSRSKEDDHQFTTTIKNESVVNLERPFRMSKINLIFEKAKRMLGRDVLPRLYSELAVQDQLEIEWKKQKAAGFDEYGEQEALVRRKFLGILNQFGLLEIYAGDFNSVESSVLAKDDTTTVFMDQVKRDKKLAKLWKTAEVSAFSEQELNTLKVEFGHHLQKLAEYEELKVEIANIEDISENSIKRFKTGENDHLKLIEKHAVLKNAYRDLKESFEKLEHRTSEMANSEGIFKDHRIAELWSLALKANLSGAELESFRAELGHFEHKINKQEYFLKQAELVKGNAHIKGRNTDVPEVYQELQQRVEGYSFKIKKWYTELKMRLAKTSSHPEL